MRRSIRPRPPAVSGPIRERLAAASFRDFSLTLSGAGRLIKEEIDAVSLKGISPKDGQVGLTGAAPGPNNASPGAEFVVPGSSTTGAQPAADIPTDSNAFKFRRDVRLSTIDAFKRYVVVPIPGADFSGIYWFTIQNSPKLEKRDDTLWSAVSVSENTVVLRGEQKKVSREDLIHDDQGVAGVKVFTLTQSATFDIAKGLITAHTAESTEVSATSNTATSIKVKIR